MPTRKTFLFLFCDAAPADGSLLLFSFFCDAPLPLQCELGSGYVTGRFYFSIVASYHLKFLAVVQCVFKAVPTSIAIESQT
jgi:hypothetical protein